MLNKSYKIEPRHCTVNEWTLASTWTVTAIHKDHGEDNLDAEDYISLLSKWENGFSYEAKLNQLQ